MSTKCPVNGANRRSPERAHCQNLTVGKPQLIVHCAYQRLP